MEECKSRFIFVTALKNYNAKTFNNREALLNRCRNTHINEEELRIEDPINDQDPVVRSKISVKKSYDWRRNLALESYSAIRWTQQDHVLIDSLFVISNYWSKTSNTVQQLQARMQQHERMDHRLDRGSCVSYRHQRKSSQGHVFGNVELRESDKEYRGRKDRAPRKDLEAICYVRRSQNPGGCPSQVSRKVEERYVCEAFDRDEGSKEGRQSHIDKVPMGHLIGIEKIGSDGFSLPNKAIDSIQAFDLETGCVQWDWHIPYKRTSTLCHGTPSTESICNLQLRSTKGSFEESNRWRS